MPLITQGKTNWKFLLIVVILAAIVGGIAIWCARKPEQPYQPAEIESTGKYSCDDNEDCMVRRVDCSGCDFSLECVNEEWVDCELSPPSGGSCLPPVPSPSWPSSCECINSECVSKELIDGTADWQTYENSSMGFSVRYDSEKWEWEEYIFPEEDISSHPEGKESLGMQLKSKNVFCQIHFIRSTPYNRETGEVPNFENLVLGEKEGVEKQLTKDIIEEEIVLGGISGKELSYIFSGTQIRRIFIPLQDNETFQVGYYGYATRDDYESEFKQILSTFRFIEEEETFGPPCEDLSDCSDFNCPQHGNPDCYYDLECSGGYCVCVPLCLP